MKALYKLHAGEGGVALRETDIPEPKANEVRIKIAYCGICGTDLHIIKDEYKANYPVIMGHEFSGIVDKAGEDVRDFVRGDAVVSMTAGSICGKCSYCTSGTFIQCSERKSIGTHMNGAMAEYMIMNADRVFHMPKGITHKEAALMEPTACVVRSVIEMSAIKAGDYVYVSGPGTIGQLTAQIAKICGAHVTIAGMQTDSERLQLAKSLGADETLYVDDADFSEHVAAITKGNMYDIVFECAGVTPSANTCLEILKKCGQFVQIGLFGRPVLFDMDKALIKQNHIVNSFASERSSWVTTLNLMEMKKLNLIPLISGVFKLEEWQTAIKKAELKEGFKILFAM